MSNLFLKIPSGNKAKEDIDVIMEQNGFRDVAWSLSSHNAVARFISKLASVLLLLFRVKKGDVLLVQYPFKKYYSLVCHLTHIRGGRVVTLIHDLGCFRRKKLTVEQEMKRLSNTDVLIAHNEAMKAFLETNGFRKPLLTLGIFDYKAPSEACTPVKKADEEWKVVYAGGLAKRKNTFLYLLDEHISGWHFYIHGKGLDEEFTKDWTHITPCGFIKSDDFIKESVGHFGLVWDGSSIDECAGDWGSYLKVNNPHKTSFYLRSGKPVIMWKEAALTPFVLQEKVGFAVGSLKEIGESLSNISEDEYQEMCRNAKAISQRLQDGYYFKTAFSKAVELL